MGNFGSVKTFLVLLVVLEVTKGDATPKDAKQNDIANKTQEPDKSWYPSSGSLVTKDNEDDGLVVTVKTAEPFPVFDEFYSTIHLYVNGYLTLGTQLDKPYSYSSGVWPEDTPIIAVFWNDIDMSSEAGKVNVDFFTEENITEEVLNNLAADSELGGVTAFQCKQVLIATWQNVSHYPANLYKNVQRTTFQMILATDNSQTVTVFIYDDLSQWRRVKYKEAATIGYSFKTDSQMENATTADKNSNIGIPGKWIWPLGNKTENPYTPCLEFLKEQNLTMIKESSMKTAPCPSTRQHAVYDSSFQVDASNTDCFVSLSSLFGAKQRCCYHKPSGALLQGPPGGGYMKFNDDPEELIQTCCNNITNMCASFYQVRPSNTYSTYRPPMLGAIWGSVHLRTVKGNTISFQAVGDYILLGEEDSMIWVIARFTDLFNNNITIMSSVLVQVNTTKIELEFSAIHIISIFIDGNATKTLSNMIDGEIITNESYDVIKTGQSEVTVQTSHGIGFIITNENDRLSMKANIPLSQDYMGMLTVDNFENFTDIAERVWMMNTSATLFTRSIPLEDNYMKVETTENLLNESSVNETLMAAICQDNNICQYEYIVTGSPEKANSTKDMYQLMEQQIKLMENTAPVFENVPETLTLNSTPIELSAYIRDLENQTVTLSVETNIQDYKLENYTFTVTDTSLSNLDYPLTIQFIITDNIGSSSMWWPLVKYCDCNQNGICNSATNNIKDNSILYTEKFTLMSCACNAGYKGSQCEQTYDVCESEPCFPNTPCSKTEDNQYQCGQCPGGFKGNGIKCYEEDECLLGTAGCEHWCKNTPGSYICSCRQGYKLNEDEKSCSDVNECEVYTDVCEGDNLYCLNYEGRYECICDPGYFKKGDKCLTAGKQFGGVLVFERYKRGDDTYEWSTSLEDKNSVSYKSIAQSVVKLVNKIYKETEGYIGTQVIKFEEGSIKAIYDLFFTRSLNVTIKDLENTMNEALETDCVGSESTCTLGDMVGVNVTGSHVLDKDLCLSPEDNFCDPSSTNCFSANGMFECSCRSGFTQWPKHTGICQDINECENEDSCSENSVCINEPGSFSCSCDRTHRRENGTCIDVCLNHKCRNGGKCKPSNHLYVCLCPGKWEGVYCETEAQEVYSARAAAIGIGVGLGVICLLLIVAMIIIYFRRKDSYSNKDYGYNSPHQPYYSSPLPTNSGVQAHGEQQAKRQQRTPKVTEARREAHPDYSIENPAYMEDVHEQQPATTFRPAGSNNQASHDYF